MSALDDCREEVADALAELDRLLADLEDHYREMAGPRETEEEGDE